MTPDELSAAWKALDALVGKLPLHQYAALRKAVEEAQESREAKKRQRLLSAESVEEAIREGIQ